MSVLVYDENRKMCTMTVQLMSQIIRENDIDTDIRSFDNADKALEYAGANEVDVAFVSMEDDHGRGFFLAGRLKKLYPQINLVPVSNELKYGMELIAMHISGYILGGITKEKMLDELDNLRYS